MSTFTIASIKPNPFRNMDRYPIRREKIEALRESIRTTGFWDNLIARIGNGKPEIAFGHHRLIALKEELGAKTKVDLIIRDLTDDSMLQLMARENMQEWATDFSVTMETVRAAVEAYGKGKIHLPEVAKKSHHGFRVAPSFLANVDFPTEGNQPYNAQTLGTFLGWLKQNGDAQNKLHDALSALEFIEKGLLSERDFEGLTVTQANTVVEQSRKAFTEVRRGIDKKPPAEQKRIEQTAVKVLKDVGTTLSRNLKKGTVAVKQARSVADEIRWTRTRTPKEKRIPPINEFVEGLRKRLGNILHPHYDADFLARLDEVVEYRHLLTDTNLGLLKTELDNLSHRVDVYRVKFSEASVKGPKRVIPASRKQLKGA